jgi:hypothetical protein
MALRGGIANLRVTIQDEQGNMFESGNAAPWPDGSGLWDYLTKASVPSGSSVIVSAVATDRLGAVRVWSDRTIIP